MRWKVVFRLGMSMDDKLTNEFEREKKRNFYRSVNMRRNKSRNALTVSRFLEEKIKISNIENVSHVHKFMNTP